MLAAVAGLVLLIREWFDWWTTEIAVTNRRIIYKTASSAAAPTRCTWTRSKACDVEQSILGRLLDYGTVTVIIGTGEGLRAAHDDRRAARPAQSHHRRLTVSDEPNRDACAISASRAGDPRLARPRRCSTACPIRITDTDYVARFTAPEFTTLCPITGQPDFAHLVIDYVPGHGWSSRSR